MSAENVKIIRRVYDAVARGDSEAVLAGYDPAVEMRFTRSPLRPVMRQEVYRGHDGLRSLFQERPDAWGGLEDICEELIDAGEASRSLRASARTAVAASAGRRWSSVTSDCGGSGTGRSSKSAGSATARMRSKRPA